MNKLDKVVTNNSRTTKYQINESIKNEPIFDTNSFNLSRGTSDHLPLLTVPLRGGKKHIATNIAGLTFLWYNGATYSIINRRRTKYYEGKIRSNKVEYSTAAGMYCTTHDFKVPFYMP